MAKRRYPPPINGNAPVCAGASGTRVSLHSAVPVVDMDHLLGGVAVSDTSIARKKKPARWRADLSERLSVLIFVCGFRLINNNRSEHPAKQQQACMPIEFKINQ